MQRLFLSTDLQAYAHLDYKCKPMPMTFDTALRTSHLKAHLSKFISSGSALLGRMAMARGLVTHINLRSHLQDLIDTCGSDGPMTFDTWWIGHGLWSNG
jgi:hypothetical protein